MATERQTFLDTSLAVASGGAIPRLRNGDRLTRIEFLRRYHAMPDVRHAELIEGRVIFPSPVSAKYHGEPHFDFLTWLGVYRAMTPGVLGGDNSTLNLDMDNAPQPDGYLRLEKQCGGQAAMVDGYLHGAPELIAEISASSVSYDLHDKLNAYRRNGVREYVVWRTEDAQVDWFCLVDGNFRPLPLGQDAIYRSIEFPGLWLDPQAVLRGDMAQVLKTVQSGIAEEPHQTFAASLRAKLAASKS